MPIKKHVHHSLADTKPKADPFVVEHQTALRRVLELYKQFHGHSPDAEMYNTLSDLKLADLQDLTVTFRNEIEKKHKPLSMVDMLKEHNVSPKFNTVMDVITNDIINHLQDTMKISNLPDDMDDGQKTFWENFAKKTMKFDHNNPTAPNVLMKKDDSDMLWKPKRGNPMMMSEMTTKHLFYSIRMMYNHIAPPEHRIGLVHTKISVQVQDNDVKRALRIGFKVIKERDDLEEGDISQLAYMARILREL